jgi:hypothetical protein
MEVYSLFILVMGLFFYFLPAIIAGNRKHRAGFAIFIINALLGWTFLGWVIALVMAVWPQDKQPQFD